MPAAEFAAPSLKRPASETLHKICAPCQVVFWTRSGHSCRSVSAQDPVSEEALLGSLHPMAARERRSGDFVTAPRTRMTQLGRLHSLIQIKVLRPQMWARAP
ncbi:hypothetical protein CWO89_40755, partial [Bradyrhizobium sp. Leo170]